MKKKLFTLLALLSVVTGIRADDAQLLVLRLIDGTKVELALADTPHVTFPDNVVQISSDRLTAEYPRYRVLDLYFVGAQDVLSIKSIADANERTIRIDYRSDSELVVYGNIEGRVVSIYAVGGQLLRRLPASHGNEMHISTSGLQTGTYILNINDLNAFKFCVR